MHGSVHGVACLVLLYYLCLKVGSALLWGFKSKFATFVGVIKNADRIKNDGIAVSSEKNNQKLNYIN